MKKKVGDIMMQIIPVMIGIILGFLITNWNDELKNDKKKKVYIENIINEISQNRNIISQIEDYHKVLRDSSIYYLSNLNLIENNNPPSFFRGLQTRSLLDNAYKSGIQTGIMADIDINNVQLLGSLYAIQKSYTDYNNMAVEGIINLDLDNKKRVLQFISITMTDFVEMEKLLLSQYRTVEETLSKRNK